MEPLRGGKLVDLLPEQAKTLIREDERGWTPAEWAFRWLWNQPEVTCVLSGMNSLPMVEENVRIAGEVQTGEMTARDFATIEAVKAEINRNIKVGCTGCAYCMPCPKGVDIPTAFRCYNRMYTENRIAGRLEYMQIVSLQKEMSDIRNCVECGKCEMHCPQHLPIRQKLKEAQRELQPWYYRVAIRVIRVFKFW